MTGDWREQPWGPIEIAFVCTGNRFRSPLAAAYLRRLAFGAHVSVSSCGADAVSRTARSALPEAIDAGASSMVDLRSHRTQWVGAAGLAKADLVIGFERNHIAAAVLDGGAGRRVTFLLTELVDLLDTVEVPETLRPPERIRALVAAADAARGPSGGLAKEVPDPFGRSRRVFEQSARDIWELTVTLAGHLFPEGPAAVAVLPRPRLRRSFPLFSRSA